MAEGELGEGGGRGAAEAVAGEGAAAVAGGAAAAAGGVEGAAVAAPEAAGPEGREGEGEGLVWGQVEASTCYHGLSCARLDAWPNRVLAFVVQDY